MMAPPQASRESAKGVVPFPQRLSGLIAHVSQRQWSEGRSRKRRKAHRLDRGGLPDMLDTRNFSTSALRAVWPVWIGVRTSPRHFTHSVVQYRRFRVIGTSRTVSPGLGNRADESSEELKSLEASGLAVWLIHVMTNKGV